MKGWCCRDHAGARSRPGACQGAFPWRDPGEGARNQCAGLRAPHRGCGADELRAGCAAPPSLACRARGACCFTPAQRGAAPGRNRKPSAAGDIAKPLCLGRLRHPAQRGRFDNSNYRICAGGRPTRMATTTSSTHSGDALRWALSIMAAKRLPLLFNGLHHTFGTGETQQGSAFHGSHVALRGASQGSCATNAPCPGIATAGFCPPCATVRRQVQLATTESGYSNHELRSDPNLFLFTNFIHNRIFHQNTIYF